jgi:hypothetical protein
MSLTLTKNIFSKYKHNHTIFIETGTYKGGSVELALQCDFKKIYTIDISVQHKLECEIKFEQQLKNKQVELLFGDTVDILPNIINDVMQPCLFWLDSHFDIHSDIRGKFDCPILQELDIIKSSKIKSHTIMIDDLRIFKNQTEWGTGIYIEHIESKLKDINPSYQFFYENGWEENDILIARYE